VIKKVVGLTNYGWYLPTYAPMPDA